MILSKKTSGKPFLLSFIKVLWSGDSFSESESLTHPHCRLNPAHETEMSEQPRRRLTDFTPALSSINPPYLPSPRQEMWRDDDCRFNPLEGRSRSQVFLNPGGDLSALIFIFVFLVLTIGKAAILVCQRNYDFLCSV
jgi:hypothetical protein